MSSFLLGNVTRTLTYDAALNISAMRDSNGTQQSFTYDSLSRLERYTSGSISQLYDYDLDGNRTKLTAGSVVTDYAISPDSNRLLSHTSPATGYVYNSAGSLLQSGALNFSYDALGRMTASLIGNARTDRTLYTTNALGQRIQKSGTAGTTSFLYGNGSQLIGEYGPSITQETIYLDGQPVGLLHNSQLMRIYADRIDTPRVITSTAGTTMWTWGDEPFGNRAPTGSITFNQRFPGQYFDAETGLNYNLARYYDAKLGRYTQSDPIGLRGGNNGFEYANSNPIARIDPNGLISNPPMLHNPGGDLTDSRIGPIESYAWQGGSGYRYYGGNSAMTGFGDRVYFSDTYYPTPEIAAQRLALPPGNTAEFVCRVQPPLGSQIQSSTAAPVPEWNRSGGGKQFETLSKLPQESFTPLGRTGALLKSLGVIGIGLQFWEFLQMDGSHSYDPLGINNCVCA